MKWNCALAQTALFPQGLRDLSGRGIQGRIGDLLHRIDLTYEVEHSGVEAARRFHIDEMAGVRES